MEGSLSTMRLDSALVNDVVQRILTVRHPKAIVLFGSHARGQAHPDSDLDILIIEQENSQPRHQRATPFLMALMGIDRAIDVLVYTQSEIDDWAAVPNAFVTTALREGKVLYENRERPGSGLAS
jgi:predicted nucleotidyltransferase